MERTRARGQRQAEPLNAYWGDDSWRDIAYQVKQMGLFQDEPEKVSNEEVAQGFRRRLKEVAGFRYVPDPLPMRNSKNAVVYYLFFASNNFVGGDIVEDIFRKYR